MLKKPASDIGRLRFRLRLRKQRAWSILNLNLDLSLLQTLRPCWAAFLSILRFVFSPDSNPSSRRSSALSRWFPWSAESTL